MSSLKGSWIGEQAKLRPENVSVWARKKKSLKLKQLSQYHDPNLNGSKFPAGPLAGQTLNLAQYFEQAVNGPLTPTHRLLQILLPFP